MFTLLLVLAANVTWAQDAAQQPTNTKKAWPAYMLGIGLGYGTGHYYLGLDGSGFLIADLAGALSMGAGAAFIVSSLASPGSNFSSGGSGASAGIGLAAIGMIIYLTSRVWEGIDLFNAVNNARQAGKLVSAEPVIEVRRTSFEAGLAFRY